MNFDKIFNEFIDEVISEGVYASRDEIVDVATLMLDIIKTKKDSTPEEIVEYVIKDNINEVEEIKNKYPIPGYTVGIRVGNINVKMFGGDIDAYERKMPNDAIFDLASMTKFYTQIVAYNLIKENYFSFDDKVKDLDPRFINLGDLTVGDILRFNTEFRTNGRLSEKSTIEEALDTLYTATVVSKEKYNYTDIGMMIIKEVMESVTNTKYEELVDEYIINKLNLKDTHLIVPKEKIDRLTGSSNQEKGFVNDPSAISVGGFSGHAGMFASSDDLINLGSNVDKLLSNEMLKDAYTPGINSARGVMGNTFTSHEKGIDMSYVDRLEPKSNFAIQGSTRTQMNIGKNSTSTILLNPASMSIERALLEERKINEKRSLEGKAPLSLVKHFTYDRDGKLVEYNLIDARLMSPSGKTVEPITTSNAKLVLRLRLFNKILTEYDKYTKTINVEKSI